MHHQVCKTAAAPGARGLKSLHMKHSSWGRPLRKQKHDPDAANDTFYPLPTPPTKCFISQVGAQMTKSDIASRRRLCRGTFAAKPFLFEAFKSGRRVLYFNDCLLRRILNQRDLLQSVWLWLPLFPPSSSPLFLGLFTLLAVCVAASLFLFF